jgi:xanthine dehydrogenase FAD-binding subunit
MFDIKSYAKADSVQQAIQLLVDQPEAGLIAGGTDVLIKLRSGKVAAPCLVDIHDVAELSFVRIEDNGDLVIGSGTRFSALAASPVIREHIPILTTAVLTIGGPQIRNMATVGGNLCNGVPSADSASPLIALNAVLTIAGSGGRREMPLEDFFLGPGRVALAHDEILTAITIKREHYQGYAGHFFKYAMRHAMDIATIGCAAVCKVENGQMRDLRLAFGTAAPVPIRCRLTEEKASDCSVSREMLAEIAETVWQDVNPRSSWRAAKAFRLQIISTLAERVVRQAIRNAGGSVP